MADDEFQDEGTLVLEQRFAIVPEWVIDADISDAAYRLYSVLLRYGQSSGSRMPSRALLARRLRKRSTDTVDRALKELVGVGAVRVERRRRGRENLTNRYHLMSTPPGSRIGGGRMVAATPAGGRMAAATPGRTGAGRVAAPVRPDPNLLTQTPPPPDPERLRSLLGVEDLADVAEECRAVRRRLGLPTARWTVGTVTAMLHRAVVEGDWPAAAALPALLALAADPATQSPARLVHPGPWWDVAERAGRAVPSADREELRQLEARLAEADGRRVVLQRQAREQLAAEGRPVTRLEVARVACRLLAASPGGEA